MARGRDMERISISKSIAKIELRVEVLGVCMCE